MYAQQIAWLENFPGFSDLIKSKIGRYNLEISRTAFPRCRPPTSLVFFSGTKSNSARSARRRVGSQLQCPVRYRCRAPGHYRGIQGSMSPLAFTHPPTAYIRTCTIFPKFESELVGTGIFVTEQALGWRLPFCTEHATLYSNILLDTIS